MHLRKHKESLEITRHMHHAPKKTQETIENHKTLNSMTFNELNTKTMKWITYIESTKTNLKTKKY